MAQQQESPEVFAIRKAVRRRTPQIFGIYGLQFSGKTFGAFMIAAGLAKPGAKIGFIDTENGRGSAFADDPDVMREIPQGYSVIELHAPFHPRRYVDAIKQFEREGVELLIIDSVSHAWDAEGGAQDMKEKDKGWKNAKLWSKRLKFAITYSQMDIIVCLRATEKTKIIGEGRDQKYIPLGVMPICEKSLPYDLSVSIRVEGSIDGKPATHLATPDKWQKGLNWFFDNWTPQLLTPDIGRKIREWNDGGAAQSDGELIQKQARYAAEQGTVAYGAYYASLTTGQKKIIFDSTHAANKKISAQADADAAETESDDDPITSPFARFIDLEMKNAKVFRSILGALGYSDVSEIPVDKRESVYVDLAKEFNLQQAA
jgi:hypothetical protein